MSADQHGAGSWILGDGFTERVRQLVLPGRVLDDRNLQLVEVAVSLDALDHLLVRYTEVTLPLEQ